MADELVSQTEFGKRTGRSQRAVAKLIRAGKLPTVKKGNRRLVPVEKALQALEDNLDPAQVAGGNSVQADGAATYSKVRTAQMAQKLRADQLEFERKKGNLVDRQVAVRQAFEWGRRIRDAAQNLSARHGAELASISGLSRHEAEQFIDEMMRGFLDRVSREKNPFT